MIVYIEDMIITMIIYIVRTLIPNRCYQEC